MKSFAFGLCLIALFCSSNAQSTFSAQTLAATGQIARVQSVPPTPITNAPMVYDLCFVGRQQSPINIITANLVQNNNIKLTWFMSNTAIPGLQLLNDPMEVKILTNFSAVRATGVDGSTNDFIDQNFHFHFGEHAVNGRVLDFEVHVIHYITTASLAKSGIARTSAIIAIPYQVDYTNARQSALLNAVMVNQPTGTQFTVNFMQLLQQDGINTETGFYSYNGALTVPNCDENVTWYILQTSLTISAAQKQLLLSRFATNPEFQLGFGNSKNLADLNGRPVYSSNSLTITTLANYVPQ